nr:histone-lysine N-methyltransferase, H3 lysine-79 specific-like isoform X1 [Procambarus clarkii]
MASSSSDDFFEDDGSESAAEKGREKGISSPMEEPGDDGGRVSNIEDKTNSNDTEEYSFEACQESGSSDGESRGSSVSSQEDAEEDARDEEVAGEADSCASDKTESNGESEELHTLFDGSRNTFPGPARPAVAAVSSRPRPTSAKSPMRVLINSPSSTLQPETTDVNEAMVPRKPPGQGSGVNRKLSGLVPGLGTPPLLVSKSSMHDRPATAHGSREASPQPARISRNPVLTANNMGINQVLTSKEKSSKIGGMRPSSVGSVWSGPRRPPPTHATTVDMPRQKPLGNYSRSLKMLGVKVPSPPPKDLRTAQRSSSSQSWQSSGKLHTRVTRRTTSLEDVTRVIPQVKTPQALHMLTVGTSGLTVGTSGHTEDEGQRATLSQAVYEEWCIRRSRQLRSRQLRAEEKSQEEETRKQKIKKDLQLKVSQAVTEWEEKKRQQKKKAREMILEEERKKNRKEKVKDEKQMKITAAVIAWETEKNELAKMRREKKRQERETKKEEERKRCLKKEESEMMFLMWKQQKNEEEKEKRKKKKQEEEELKSKEEQEELEKRQGANLAFAAWKRSKLLEADENMRKVIVTSEIEKSSAARRSGERSTEALKAYEEWLGQVEEREPLRDYENARAAILAQLRPPWCPGGSSSSLLKC